MLEYAAKPARLASLAEYTFRRSAIRGVAILRANFFRFSARNWFHSVNRTTKSAFCAALYGSSIQTPPGSRASPSCLPCGSHRRTFAPAPIMAGTKVKLGASRMSSVFGLKVTPKTAIILSRRLSPYSSDILSIMRRLMSLFTLMTVSVICIGTACS